MKLINGLLLLAARARTYDVTTAEERQRRGRNLRFGGYTSGPQLIKKLNHAGWENSGYGNSVSISETHFAVGAKGTGMAFVYDASDGEEVAQLWVTGGDQYGHAVAISAGVLVVGAPKADSEQGKAYVYDEAAILANAPKLVLDCSDCSPGDEFGWSVATDGVYAVIGAPGGDTGKAYLFDVSSGAELNKLHTVNPPPDVGDAFGTSVALGGTLIAVGAPGRTSDTGAIDLYSTEDLTWSHFRAAKEGQPGDKLGSSVAASTTSVIGGAPDRPGGADTGAVYTFKTTGALSPSTLFVAPGGENGDHFGDAVTCASTGWPMLVGARGYEDDEGAVYIYADADAAPVILQPPGSSVALQEFGYSVAYASGKFVVGARELGDDKIGAAFLYSL